MNTLDSAVSSVLVAQQSSLASQINTAVAVRGQSIAKQQGDAAVALLQAAVKLSQQAGLGEQFDHLA